MSIIQSIRERAAWLVFGLIAVSLIGFLLMDARRSNFFGGSRGTVVGVIDGQKIQVDDFDQRAADISVEHPQIVENYRAAHGIHTSQQHDISTEQQREAFVHYRALFDKLLETTTDKDTAQERQAHDHA